MTNNLSILGATGSIGTQALDVCEKRGIRITCLTAHSNDKLLEQQARKYRPHTPPSGCSPGWRAFAFVRQTTQPTPF